MDILNTHLPKLGPHLPTALGSLVLFTSVHLVFAPLISRTLFGEHYATVKRRSERNKWAIRIVSQLHAFIVIPLALRCIGIKALDEDRLFGWDERVGVVHAVACGYFLWDTLDAIINYTDFGFIVHGFLCLAIYTLSFKPFLAYFGVRCLLWETSTVFLNINWFLDKTNRTGSKLQLYNGILLLAAFFGVRLCYGGKVSYDFWVSLYHHRDQISTVQLAVYGGGNLVLQGLNWFWFSKMIAALRKRFNDPKGKGKATVNGHTHLNGNGTSNGYGSNDRTVHEE
jgi:hypothetical protein